MKSFHRFCAFSLLFATIALSGILHPAAAQPPNPDFPEWREIPVHNIPPTLLAYRLDPADCPLPPKYFPQSTPPLFYERYPYPKINLTDQGVKVVEPIVKPFEGKLFPDDSHNELWVMSTEKAFDQIKLLADSLDTPIPKIKISMKAIVINPDDFKTIPTLPPNPKVTFSDDSASRTKIASNNVETELNQLVAQGKAKVIDSSHITTMDNYNGVIESTDSFVPVSIGIKNGDGPYESLSNETDKSQQLFLEKRFVKIVLPSINSDDSVTVAVMISSNEVLTHQTPSGAYDTLWVKSLQEKPVVSTMFVVNDGQTAMLPGYNSTALGIDDKNQNVTLFVTVSIVN